MDYGTFKTDVLKVIDEYSARGVALSSAKTADLELRMGEAVNDILLDLAQTAAKIPASYTIVQNPVENELTYDTSTAGLFTPGSTDVTVELTGAQSFFFEAIGPCEYYVEEEISGVWTSLSSGVLSSTQTEFVEVKNNVTLTSTGNDVRLRLTGLYPFSYRNHKLYPYKFPSSGTVQQHRPYFKYDLPSDFMGLEKISLADRYNKPQEYRSYIYSDADKQIGLNRYDTGEFIVDYYRVPTRISTAAASTETVDCLSIALPTAALGVAAKLQATENLQLSAYMMNIYEARKGAIYVQEINLPDEIENKTGW